MKKFVLIVLGLSACATNQEAMLKQPSLLTMRSSKKPGAVAGCALQRLHTGPSMGTDGTNYWVTISSAAGVVARYDFKPDEGTSGTVVEYRSRLKIRNGLDKVQSCL